MGIILEIFSRLRYLVPIYDTQSEHVLYMTNFSGTTQKDYSRTGGIFVFWGGDYWIWVQGL